MKISSQLLRAQIENVTADPAAGITGRIVYNTTLLQARLDDGANYRSLLRNDQHAVIGNSVTAAQNIRFHRGASGLLQLVTGSDATAEGTPSASLNQLSSRHENYTTAGRPAFGNAGRVIWDTDLSDLLVDTGAAWVEVREGTVPINRGGTGATTKAAGFDALSPLTTGGDLLYGGASGTGTRLANGTAGQALLSAGGTSAPTWGTPSIATAAKTGNYTLTNADDVIELDATGGVFTLTLHDPTTAVKKPYYIKKSASDTSDIAVTIGGFNVDATSQKIITRGEVMVVYPNGTSWIMLNHITDTGWVSYTPATTQGFGTVSSLSALWRRDGPDLHFRIKFTAGTVTSSEARVGLPFTTASGLPSQPADGIWSKGSGTTAHGGFVLTAAGLAYVTFSNQQTLGSGSVDPTVAVSGTSSWNNNEVVAFWGKVQIQDWK